MNKTFFARFALPILMLVFFTVPFALRGARLSFSTMKNDIKDWLPDKCEGCEQLPICGGGCPIYRETHQS